MNMPENSLDLFVSAGEDATPTEIDHATQQLRRALEKTDVDRIDLVTGKTIPDGGSYRSADPVTIGSLLIAWSATGSVLPKLIDVIQSWVTGKRTVTLVDKDGNTLTIRAHPLEEEEKLIREWKARAASV